MQKIISKYSLKIGFTLAIIAWIAPYLKIQQPYWIIITAMVTMLPTVGATLAKSKLRGINTATGVLIGGVLAYILNNQITLVIIFSAILLFFSCYYIQTHYNRFVFCFAALLILLLSFIHHQDPWQFAFWRFADTLIGIAIGFIVSTLIFPSWSKNLIPRTIITTTKALNALSKHVLQSSYVDKDLCLIEKTRAHVIKSTEKVKQEFIEMKHETLNWNKHIVILDAIILMLERLRFDLYLLMDLKNYHIGEDNLNTLRLYSADVFNNVTRLIKSGAPTDLTNKPPSYKMTDNAYINQLIRNYIADLSNLQQNVNYCLSK